MAVDIPTNKRKVIHDERQPRRGGKEILYPRIKTEHHNDEVRTMIIMPPPPYNINLSTQTANYTLALSDRGSCVAMNAATALTLTVPPSSAVAFPVGTEIGLMQYGAGALSIVAGAGVTLRYLSTLTMVGQYAFASLLKIGTNEWVVAGALQ